MFLTIFTPVFNRERSIRAVYDSLCHQSCKDFEWLVVNDGSTDKTPEIIGDIINNHDGSFPIRYFSKENEGLARTINKGLDWATGVLWFRVDSDDIALPNAVEIIKEKFNLIKDNSEVCALAFLSELHDGKINGYHPFIDEKEVSIVDYRHIYHGVGDRAEVMKIDVYRHFRFPEYEGEKFCSEGVVWDRIAKKYKFRYIPQPVYQKGIVDDSITASIFKVLKRNCQGTSTLYYEILRDFSYLPYKERLVLAVKYYRYAFYAKRPIMSAMPLRLWILALPIGLVIMLWDRINHPDAFK